MYLGSVSGVAGSRPAVRCRRVFSAGNDSLSIIGTGSTPLARLSGFGGYFTHNSCKIKPRIPVRRCRSILENLDRLAPGLPLRPVNFPKVEHLPLNNPPPGYPAVLHYVPVAVRFSVLLAICAAQKHDAQYHLLHNPEKRVGLHYILFRPPEHPPTLEIA
jgi:hypothetical protein